MVMMGGFIYFTANSDTAGRELFKLNPSGGTPTLVKDINPGIASANVSDITVIGTTIYFTADPGTRIRELWKTDGSTAGTVRVSDLSARNVSSPSNLIAFGNTLYFNVLNAANQIDLWFTNGTAAGTKPHAEAGLLKRVLQVSVLNDEGDDLVTGADATAAATSSLSIDLSTVSATDLIRVDLTTLIRNVIAAGKTRVTLRLQFTTTSSDLLSVFVPDAAHQSGLNVTTAREEGVLGDLYDSAGSLLARGKSILDLRALDAGTYYLRVYNPFAASQTAPLPFTLEASVPFPGIPILFRILMRYTGTMATTSLLGINI